MDVTHGDYCVMSTSNYVSRMYVILFIYSNVFNHFCSFLDFPSFVVLWRLHIDYISFHIRVHFVAFEKEVLRML